MSNKYRLLAVLVHSGSVHGGHYYAYIRPDGTNWLKFDDETVTNATEEEAIQDNLGRVERADEDAAGQRLHAGVRAVRASGIPSCAR